ncbi:uncharacterized proline-rich protein [Juglans microcarpa x Juglans regia]|uniref:uncharacterized proline-rich protein n=1 Tax=Juglans microcarpa x Juglans regia TaxID=2249226 RepID=UPI001B7E3A5B|nr:uncharacterized proline-rich protein [Juglans microcarpa x Juglans regia]XP_041023861.1 uncharacterized proline-rich protein [Juglans microcarpa x Juglans regia]
MVQDHPQQPSPALPASTHANPPPPPPSPPPPPPFDPSRMIGIIKRKALIKELAAAYHAECLAYCQELLELQRKWEEPFIDLKAPEDSRKETVRPAKRLKKSR